jgi:hypothetical protein
VIVPVTSAYQTNKDMNASYDAMADFLESIGYFLKRLDIYTQISHNPALDEMVVKIILELLSAFALVTKGLKQGQSSESILVDVLLPCSINTEIFGKKLFGEKDVKAVLHRLDRLTQDEARTTEAEILKVIYGLVQNMNVVIDGEQTLIHSSTIYGASFSPDDRPSVDGVQEALGTCRWQHEQVL